MKRRPASLPVSAECVDTTAQLMHDRGPPLLFVDGKQEHGGVYVFVDNFGAICDIVAVSQKWCQNGAISSSPMDCLFTKQTSIWAWVRHSGQKWTDANFPHVGLQSAFG